MYLQLDCSDVAHEYNIQFCQAVAGKYTQLGQMHRLQGTVLDWHVPTHSCSSSVTVLLTVLLIFFDQTSRSVQALAIPMSTVELEHWGRAHSPRNKSHAPNFPQQVTCTQTMCWWGIVHWGQALPKFVGLEPPLTVKSDNLMGGDSQPVSKGISCCSVIEMPQLIYCMLVVGTVQVDL
jgi:hypothetical protein